MSGKAGDLSKTLLQLAGQAAPVEPDFEALRRQLETGTGKANPIQRAFEERRAKTAIDAPVEASRRAAERHPDSPVYQMRYADALRHRGDTRAASVIYRRFTDLPFFGPMARYYLAAMGAADVPPVTPPEVLITLFDAYADNFETDLINALKYQGPTLLHDAVRTVIGPDAQGLDIMDAGCGTGLCGEKFRSMARRLDGIDAAGKMIQKAGEKDTYDRLICADLCEALHRFPNGYDLILAADVLIYIGDVAPVFAAAAAALRPRGLFAFTTEHDTCESFSLSPAARYRQADGYIREQSGHHRFEVVHAEPGILRFEHGEGVEGSVFVLSLRPDAQRERHQS